MRWKNEADDKDVETVTRLMILKLRMRTVSKVWTMAILAQAITSAVLMLIVWGAAVAAPAYELSVKVRTLSSTKVEFTVTTNIPLPVEVMVGVDLADQRPDETYIGYTERLRLASPVTVHVLDTSEARKPLPSGNYEAVVSFYQRWGAKNGNPAAASIPDMEAKQLIVIEGSGESADLARSRNKMQMWVMENFVMNSPWNERYYVERLGNYEKSRATLSHLHDAYYFPRADMTLLVNRLKNDVTVWRLGRASK